MIVSHAPGAVKKFRRTPWRFQQTVERPHAEQIDRFVSSILSAQENLKGATLIIDGIVFGTERITRLCPLGSDVPLRRESSLVALSKDEMKSLLVAAFMDGLDFLLVPTPKPFVVYADHDDWVTFFTNTKSNLNRIVEPLTSSGFKLIDNWHREI